jgi:hypothetical protein
MIVGVVPGVKGDVHQWEVEVQTIEQEDPLDQRVFIALLILMVLIVGLEVSKDVVHFTKYDDHYTVKHRVDHRKKLFKLRRCLNDVSLFVSFSFEIKDHVLIENHCGQN